MRSLDIRVEESDPRYGRDLRDSIEEVAGIVDREAAGRRLIRRIQGKLARATAGYKSRPRVMLVLGVGRTPYVFLPNSWGGDLLQRAGARLVTAGAESPSGFARISDEVVVTEDPDIIIGVPHARAEDLDGIRRYMRVEPDLEADERRRRTTASTSRATTRCCRPTSTSRRRSAASARATSRTSSGRAPGTRGRGARGRAAREHRRLARARRDRHPASARSST